MTEPARQTLRNKRTGSIDTLERGDDGQWRLVSSEAPSQPGMGDLRTAERDDERAATIDKLRGNAITDALIPGVPVGKGDVAAFGRGAGQGASMGFGDEAGGFGAYLASKFGGETPRAGGRGVGAGLSQRTSYEVARDAERAANAQAKAQHPLSYGGGEIIGSAAPAMVMGAGGGAAARTIGAGRALTATATGAAMGGLEGVGRSEARDPNAVAREGAIGAGVGGGLALGTELAAPYVAKGAQWAARKLDNTSEALDPLAAEQKLAAAGVERGGMRKLRDKPGGLERYAEGAERLGIGKNRLGIIPASVRQHAKDAEAAAAAASAQKNVLADEIEAAGALVDGRDVAARLRELKADYGKGPAGKAMRDQIEEIAQDYESWRAVPFSEMNTERRVWGDATNFDAGSVKQKLRKKIYGVLNESMSDAADSAAQPPIDVTSKMLAPNPALRGKAEGIDADSYAIPYSAEAETVPRMGTARPPRGKTRAPNALKLMRQIANGTDLSDSELARRAGLDEAAIADLRLPEAAESQRTAIAPPAGAGADLEGSPLSPGVGQAWRRANEDEHIARKLGEFGENKLNQAGNRGMSPTDYAAGGLGYAASADPLTAAAAVGANKLLKSREHAIAHQALRATQGGLGFTSDVLNAVGKGLSRATPQAEGAAAGAVAGMKLATPAVAQSVADSALDDPQHGAMLAKKQGQERELAYSVLMAQDPQFRARQRAKAAKADQQTGDSR